MNIKTFSIPVAALLFTSSLALAANSEHVHRFLTGKVSKITSGIAKVETSERTDRFFSIKDAKREGIMDLKVGDHLLMEFDEGNQMIDIDRLTKDGKPEHEERHESVFGTLDKYDRTKKEVVIKALNDQSKTYRLKDAAATKMVGVKNDTLVLLEIDEENGLVNDFLIRQ